jgi:hypothetical protein
MVLIRNIFLVALDSFKFFSKVKPSTSDWLFEDLRILALFLLSNGCKVTPDKPFL